METIFSTFIDRCAYVIFQPCWFFLFHTPFYFIMIEGLIFFWFFLNIYFNFRFFEGILFDCYFNFILLVSSKGDSIVLGETLIVIGISISKIDNLYFKPFDITSSSCCHASSLLDKRFGCFFAI